MLNEDRDDKTDTIDGQDTGESSGTECDMAVQLPSLSRRSSYRRKAGVSAESATEDKETKGKLYLLSIGCYIRTPRVATSQYWYSATLVTRITRIKKIEDYRPSHIEASRP